MPSALAVYKLRSFLLFAALYGVFYIIPNFFSDSIPHELPLWAIDQNTPFLPWTFIFYTSDYFVFISAILLHRTKDRFDAFARLMITTLIICGGFFYFFPTIYPRPVYPEHSNWFIQFLLDVVSAADSPRNCFPSMHVALTAGATWSLRYKGPKITLLFSIWSLFIFASTLTTKQHYFLDILGGLSVATLVAFLEWALFERKYLPAVAALYHRWNP